MLDKLRKAAAHWKKKHDELKESAAAATPAGGEGAPVGGTAPTALAAASEEGAAEDAAATDAAQIESDARALHVAAERIGELEATVEKWRKAAAHWKKKHDELKSG